MKPQKQMFLLGILSALLLPSLCALSGCSSNDTIKEDPTLTQKRVDAAGKMRSYFDKSNGNYDSLSAEDKAALNALTGVWPHGPFGPWVAAFRASTLTGHFLHLMRQL